MTKSTPGRRTETVDLKRSRHLPPSKSSILGGIPHVLLLQTAFLPDGKVVFVGGFFSLIVVPAGKELRRLLGGKPPHDEVVAFSADGQTVAAGGGDGVLLWDFATGKELRQLKGYLGDACAIAF